MKREKTKRKLVVDIDDIQCEVTLITEGKYSACHQKSVPFFEDYRCYLSLCRSLQFSAPNFNHPQLYAALKTLFGESSTMIDPYKCSFGYPFFIRVKRKNGNFLYMLNFTDIKGGINFLFRKILTTKEDLEKYADRSFLREPFEDEFSKNEMKYFMGWFTFYLVGFMESHKNSYKEEFVRTIESCNMIYGFEDNQFFEDSYDDCDDYYRAVDYYLENTDIPFNRFKENE